MQINFNENSISDGELLQEIKTIMSYLYLTPNRDGIRNSEIIQGNPVIRTQIFKCLVLF